jgi:uncharacterized protein (DUF302 family)
VISRVALLVLICCKSVLADQGFLQASCDMLFPEAMVSLQEAVANHGYTVSRVQHIDKGLRQRGYETGRYQLVFFGQPLQMDMVRVNHPGLMPYLPLKITLYEEEEHVIASALQPAAFASLFDDVNIHQLLTNWQKDLTKIMAFYGQCDETVRSTDEAHQPFLSYMPVGK